MSRLTASRLGLAKHCPGFASLPHSDSPTPESEAGSGKHADQDAAIKAGRVPSAYTERWPGLAWRSEVKFAIDIVTGRGRELGVGGDRDYSPATADEVPGTADVVGIGSELVVVIDKKSFDPNVPRAAVNAQVHVAALALCRAYGIDVAHVAIDHEVRELDVAELDAIDLEAFAIELREIVGAVALAASVESPILNEGSWCRWCPAFNHCPAKLALKADAELRLALVDDGDSPVPFLEDDEDAADAYEFVDRMRMLIKRVDAALYARAKDRPIPLRNGMVFGAHPKESRETLDADKLYALVKEKHGQGIADAAVIRSATKTRLKEALEFAGVASKAAAEREILTELRKRGGTSRETKIVIEEHAPEVPMLKVVG